MKILSSDFLQELSTKAQSNPRKRLHLNIHDSYQDPCQRLLNAIEPESYIRPHRHASDPRAELLIALRGLMTLVIFDDNGNVTGSLCFGVDSRSENLAVGVEVPPNTWHTVLALEPGCVLLEVKAGPFDPNQPKDLASWAPEEGSSNAVKYQQQLFRFIGS
jgi:cupin fold WbuC family metalloprotein